MKLHFIRLKLLLQYRAILLITILHIIFAIIYTTNYEPQNYLDSSGYIVAKEFVEDSEVFKYETKDAYIYSGDKYNVGEKIKYDGACSLLSQRNFVDFNYNYYLFSQDKKCMLYNPKISKKADKSAYYTFKQNVRIVNSETDILGLKNAIVFGDKKYVSEDNLQLFYNLHLAHLIALSGMHLVIITALFNKFFKIVFKTSEQVNIATIIFITLYVFLISMSHSMQRALLIYYITIILKLVNVRLSKLSIVLITFNILLFSNYFIIYSLSFIYSFLCYFIVILLIDYKWNFIKVYAVIMLFMTPILINTNNTINIIGLLVSPFISIFFELIYFPYILICTLFHIPDLASIYFMKFLELIYTEKMSYTIGDISVIYIVLYYFSICVLITVKRTRWINYILSIVLFIASMQLVKQNYIEIMFFDVGQGDAQLILLDDGVSILIDSGGSGYSEKQNASYAKYTIIPYLKKKGISKLDYVIATHGDIDHIGSMKYVLDEVHANNVLVNCNEVNDLEQKFDYIQVNDNINIKGINYNIYITCRANNDENNSSIVVDAQLYNFNYLTMGDLGYISEEQVARDIDILKVSHHGSNSSTSKNLVNITTPKYAIISVGKNNYGHPTEEVLNNLEGVNIYRTDYDGAVKILIDERINVETKLGE